jgi:hypothetical protein
MFLTDDSAEIPTPILYGADEQERMWSWVRLGIYAPYYLVQITVAEGKEHGASSFRQNIILSEVTQLQDLVRQQNDYLKIVNVSILIPDYMRSDQDDYTLGRISEIWGCSNTGARRFLLKTGEELHFTLNDEKPDFKLLFKI